MKQRAVHAEKAKERLLTEESVVCNTSICGHDISRHLTCAFCEDQLLSANLNVAKHVLREAEASGEIFGLVEQLYHSTCFTVQRQNKHIASANLAPSFG